jgi:selenium metabolism protein YedF
LERSGFKVMSWLEGSDYAVSGFRVTLPLFETPKEEPERDIAKVRPEPEERKILILLGANCLGRGDEDLGRKLIANFLATLKEMGRELWCLVLVNSAVQLAVAGSQVLASLQELEQAGVELLVCGTCLNHFQLLEQKQAGATTNMLDIISHMRVADQVITLT